MTAQARKVSTRRKPQGAGPISSAIAASSEALQAKTIGPAVREIDFETVGTLVSQPAWDNIGFHARMAFAVLHSETRGTDITKIVAEFLDEEGGEPYEDTLVKISQTRIALLEVAVMMKASLRKQWRAVDAYLIARGLPPTQADDELCGDDELLALRPAFETGRNTFKAATAAVAVAGRKHSEESPQMQAAYAAQNEAIDADDELVARIASVKARTKEGIHFKREVRDYWKDCQQADLDASIFADLLAYVEASP